MGAPPRKKNNSMVIIHQSQRPPAPAVIDFSSLGLEFPVKQIPEFTISRTSWSPKPATPPQLPFCVDRTDIGDQLPVYVDYKGAGTKVVTILRKVKGDVAKFKSEMEKVVGKEVQIKNGKLVVDGHYRRRLKVWLTALGF